MENSELRVKCSTNRQYTEGLKAELNHYKSGYNAGVVVINFLNRNWLPDALPFLRGIVHMSVDNLRTMAENLPFFDGRETNTLDTKILAEYAAGGKGSAIKLYRQIQKVGLTEAKNYVEDLIEKHCNK